jgi:flagellar motility protein MotE (MotC chaperone)
MKIWQAFLLAALLAVLPILTSCELLGALGTGKSAEQQAYEEQLKAYREYQEQLKAYREQQEAYRQEVIKAYNEQLKNVYGEYEEGIEAWYEERQKSIEEAVGE